MTQPTQTVAATIQPKPQGSAFPIKSTIMLIIALAALIIGTIAYLACKGRLSCETLQKADIGGSIALLSAGSFLTILAIIRLYLHYREKQHQTPS